MNMYTLVSIKGPGCHRSQTTITGGGRVSQSPLEGVVKTDGELGPGLGLTQKVHPRNSIQLRGNVG